MTLGQILALVGAAFTCVIVSFSILYGFGTANHVFKLERLGHLGMSVWSPMV